MERIIAPTSCIFVRYKRDDDLKPLEQCPAIRSTQYMSATVLSIVFAVVDVGAQKIRFLPLSEFSSLG